MKLIDLSVTEFKNMVASNSPAPGGGSVSALASTLGTSLLTMVGGLTISKKKFRSLDENIQNKFSHLQSEFNTILEELMLLIDKDTEAFNLIMNAYQLPKISDDEKGYRNQKIQEGTIEAIKVPFRVVELSYQVLENVDYIIEYGNKNTLSDIGVSVLMLYAGLEGAILNVKINLSGIEDMNQKEYYSSKVDEYLSQAKKLRDKLTLDIHHLL
ncbi:MAG: cyclodeaminase/cyclohydrolase family protein [Bacilli bacterium]|nr:cyclodeaminase/cyclohydrolase family protein [Bacilli bacterium]